MSHLVRYSVPVEDCGSEADKKGGILETICQLVIDCDARGYDEREHR